MRETRCFVDTALAIGNTLEVPETTTNHLLRVLRLSDGDRVTFFNGDGCDYRARLALRGKNHAVAHVDSLVTLANESSLKVTLAQGIARGEKMDFILQKATELGVTAITPLITERTEVKLSAERLQKRMAHWRAVVCSACEQSGRARVPELNEPRSLAELVTATERYDLRLTLDPLGAANVSNLRANADALVAFAIGPEGGLSPAERGQLATAGFVGLKLGPRILRTETAGLAALAALQSRFGDLA